MTSSLIPEKPILIPPSLAATIGLEEATLLSVLDEYFDPRLAEEKNDLYWLALSAELLQRRIPFWTAHDIQRISKNLVDKGVILLASAPFMESGELQFAFNESPSQQRGSSSVPAPGAKTPANSEDTLPHNQLGYGANRIAPNWQPSDEVLAHISQRNIPRDFALAQLPEFITYWRERDEPAHAWGAKFLRQVVTAWRHNETQFQRRDSDSAMDSRWRPSADAMEILVDQAGINREFVEDAIPEFVLYWRERGDSSRTWNSKFIQHVRKQWHHYTATVENDVVPKIIPADWQPTSDVYDVLRLANIDQTFAISLLPEFVLFWRDSGQINRSWNTKFLQHVKYHWAKKNGLMQTGSSERNHGNTDTIKTRDRSLIEDLTDRSWAV